MSLETFQLAELFLTLNPVGFAFAPLTQRSSYDIFYSSDDWSVSRLEAKKESYMKVLKEQFDDVVAADPPVTDGNRSGINARSKKSIDRLINSDPNMFDNSERSEIIYQSEFILNLFCKHVL